MQTRGVGTSLLLVALLAGVGGCWRFIDSMGDDDTEGDSLAGRIEVVPHELNFGDQEVLLTGSEQLLEYGLTMLSPPMTSPGGPMDGFLRESAGLRVIFVSDEDDQSPNTVTHYLSGLQALKKNPDYVILSAVSGQASGCADGNLTADPAPRLTLATMATGGLSASFCGIWVQELSATLWYPWYDPDHFELTEDPVEGTITVEIDGVPVYSGWYYDAVINAVVFEPDHVPELGVTITIRYQRLGTCDG